MTYFLFYFYVKQIERIQLIIYYFHTELFLRAINTRRRQYFNTGQLQWDEEMAVKAQTWAEVLLRREILEHDPINRQEGFGETLAFVNDFNSLQRIVELAVRKWYVTSKCFVFYKIAHLGIKSCESTRSS